MLGFVDKTKIPRHSFMGEVDLVVPKKPVVNLKLFTALVSAMISLGKYAIARYVSRSSKSGVTPKMVALIPYRTA